MIGIVSHRVVGPFEKENVMTQEGAVFRERHSAVCK